MSPVPLLFLALSGLVLIPSYPYYVTFFYNALGIFLFFQSCRENRDVYYMMLLLVSRPFDAPDGRVQHHISAHALPQRL